MTFRCTITHSNAGCFLYLEGQDKAPDLIHKDQENFNLPRVHKGNEGRYSCQCYSGAALVEWSDVSNSLDLVVKGERSPKLHLTLLFLHCHILEELEKRMWRKKAGVIGVQAEDYSFLQTCANLANSSETLQMAQGWGKGPNNSCPSCHSGTVWLSTGG